MKSKTYGQGHRPLGPALIAAAGTSLVIILLGCSEQDETYGLQPLPSGSSSAPTTAGLTLTPAQQTVADAVSRYDAVIKAMSDGAPLDMKKIRAVAVDPWATRAGRNLLVLKAQKQRTTGTHQNSVQNVAITGRDAKVRVCSDARLTKVVSGGPPANSSREGC
jgi:hypothetical protein